MLRDGINVKVNHPRLKAWASSFNDGIAIPFPEALLPAIPAVARVSMFFAALISLSMELLHDVQR